MSRPVMLIAHRRTAPAEWRGIRYALASRAVVAYWHLPNFALGFVWNRPTAVYVATADGDERRLPIRDLTRIMQLGALGSAALLGLVLWARSRYRTMSAAKNGVTMEVSHGKITDGS